MLVQSAGEGFALVQQLAEIKQKLNDFFRSHPEVRFLSLFGSFSAGQEHPGSDIDLAIDAARRLTPDELVQFSTDLSLILGREVDLVDLTVARGALLEEAIMKGQVIFQRSPEEFARLLKTMWYDKEDDDRFRQRTQQTRLSLWSK